MYRRFEVSPFAETAELPLAVLSLLPTPMEKLESGYLCGFCPLVEFWTVPNANTAMKG
ncbi:MAG TPA: hypothetical protein VHM25_06320 [Polyangiaceae bacterium]|nr:hypothetical protein [Polyangiaceae bacterium]